MNDPGAVDSPARDRGVRVREGALRSARLAAGLTQMDVAIAVGVYDGATVFGWESGAHHPRESLLAPLAKVLRVSVWDLVEPVPSSWLHRTRVERGLSSRDVATQMGVSESTYRMWESSARVPRRKNLQRLAEVLEVNAHDLDHHFQQV